MDEADQDGVRGIRWGLRAPRPRARGMIPLDPAL